MLDDALAQYPTTRRSGIDNWNPRVFNHLPPDFRLRLLDVMELWEENPEMFIETVTSIIFIDKPDGGNRPIGLIISVLTVWSRIRAETCKEWEADHSEDFFWGASAQPAEKVGWEHNMLAAWAKAKGLSMVILMADIQKIYERVDHADLQTEAAATGFNIKLFRCLCVLYEG